MTLKKVETWSLKLIVLRSRILTILISRPLNGPLGTFFDASNFDLKKRRLPKSLRGMSSTFRGPQLEEGGTRRSNGLPQEALFDNILSRLDGSGYSGIELHVGGRCFA